MTGSGEAGLGSDTIIVSSKSGRAGAENSLPFQPVRIASGWTGDTIYGLILPPFQDLSGVARMNM